MTERSAGLIAAAALAIAATLSPAASSREAEARPMRAANPSDEIRIKVQVLRSAPRTNVVTITGFTSGKQTKSVAFRFIIEGAPPRASYQLFFQDMGMQAEGLPPAPVPGPEYQFTIDATGAWTPALPAFHARDFARGEWIQLEVRSIDGTVSKAVRFTPFR